MGAGCKHSNVKKVWKIGKGIVFAGNRSQVENEIWQHGVDMLVDLCNGDIKGPFKADKGAQELLKDYPSLQNPNPPTLSISWPDGGVPKLGEAFWKELVRFVRDGHKICVFCLGGHGRTGTALVCLAHFAGRKGDVLKEVREIYCPCAVETGAQISYIKAFGVETAEHGSYGFSYSGTSWTQGGGTTKDPKVSIVKKAEKTDKVPGDCIMQNPTGGTTKFYFHRVPVGMSACLDCLQVVRTMPVTLKDGLCQTGAHQGSKHLPVKESGLWTCGHCGEELERESKTKNLPPLLPPSGLQIISEKVEGECNTPGGGHFGYHLVKSGESECKDCGQDLKEYFKEQGRTKAGEPVLAQQIQIQES